MHDNYNSSAERKISYSRYEQEIIKMTISFVKLGTEECEQCDIQAQHMEGAHSAHKALEPDGVWIFPKLCKTCLEFNKHKDAGDSTRSEYEKDKQINRFCSPGTLYLSADMQVVVMMPRMPGYKTAIFTKMMVCFHETFAPIRTFTDRKPAGRCGLE